MLKQPIDIKIEEEIRGTVSSSLANIGLDTTKRHYDTVTGKSSGPANTSSIDDKGLMIEHDKNESTNDDKIIIDGDETPKVSRVSTRVTLMSYVIEYLKFSTNKPLPMC